MIYFSRVSLRMNSTAPEDEQLWNIPDQSSVQGEMFTWSFHKIFYMEL